MASLTRAMRLGKLWELVWIERPHVLWLRRVSVATSDWTGLIVDLQFCVNFCYCIVELHSGLSQDCWYFPLYTTSLLYNRLHLLTANSHNLNPHTPSPLILGIWMLWVCFMFSMFACDIYPSVLTYFTCVIWCITLAGGIISFFLWTIIFCMCIHHTSLR